MNRTAIILAAVLLPAVAHAEFNARNMDEVRPAAAKRIKLPAKTITETPRLTIEDMLGKINGTYMTGLRRCYTKALAHDPNVGGKVTLTFTVNPWGRVSADVAGVSEMVSSCVATQARQWQFEVPRDSKGKAVQETFRISLMLASN